MRAVLLTIAKKTAYVIAIILMIMAVLLTISRTLRPVLNQYRPVIEKMASDLLTVPVTIEEISVTWYQYQPGIKLKHVTLFDKSGKKTTFQIEKIGVFFSIPQSLWHWKPVPVGLMLSGADVSVQQNAKGEIELIGMPTVGNQPLQSETKITDVLQWISSQPRLILQDVDIHYTPHVGPKRFVTLYNLNFKNTETDHIILGKFILHQDVATDVTLAVQWKGKYVDFDQIKAKIYLYISGFSFSQWLSNYTWQGWQITRGLGSAKIWATWNHGRIKRVQSAFQLYDLALYSQTDKSTHVVTRLSGNVGWRRQGEKGETQTVAANDLLIDLPSHLWPVTSFSATLVPDEKNALTLKTATFGYIDLADLQAYLFSSPIGLSADNKKMLNEMKLKGELQNAAMVFGGAVSDWSKLSANANVSGLTIDPWHKLPGIKNISGTVKWNGSQGDFSLHSKQVTFQYDTVFVKPIISDQLTGDIAWQRNANQDWVLTTSGLQILNNDLAANVNGSFTIPISGSPVADLKANFTLLKANHTTRYLPLRIFDADLVEWLQEAFLSGEIKTGKLVFAGPIAGFPFDKNNGTFSLEADINNIDFRYAPDWPIMRQIKGKLLFTGRKISIDVLQAKLMNIPVNNVHAEIPNLGGEKTAFVNVEAAELQTDFAQGLAFVHASPLEKTLGKMFAGMKASGPITVKLGLKVPLSNKDKVQVKGAILLNNAEVKLVPWKLELNKLNGTINFTEDTTDAENIKALLFNKPLQFSLATVQKQKNLSVVRASFASNLSIDDLEAWLKVPFAKMVNGATNVTGDIDFSLNTPIEIHLRTNLVGITLNLPNEFSKKADVAKDFTANIFVQEKQPLKLKMSYDKSLSAALILNQERDEFKLISANVRLGGGDPSWPDSKPGLYVTGTIDQLDWDKIKQYTSQSSDNKLLADYPLQNIDVQVARLVLPNQLLSNLRLQITPQKNMWDINVSSAEIVGNIKVPVNFNAHTAIVARFDKLNLQSAPGAKSSPPGFVVKALPSISLVANNVTYNGLPFGQINLKTTPSENGAAIQTLRITSSRMDLQASGSWSQTNTQLQGTMTSSRLSDFFDSMGLDTRNFVCNKGDVNFTLNWRGPFFAPALASMNGRISMKLGPGRVVDIGESSDAKMSIGRMLSIFSLQTIPRRLTLDFSDLFQKGYSFDSVVGDYALRNGNAFTTNMRLSGPVARVDISGRIGLSAQDYDFTISVTPLDVTSSLPVAATLIGGPVGGLAALAVNTVVGSQISKAATSYFSVRGPWSHPTWEVIKTPNQATPRR
jgi:uncharacterized protein (TIGR02099 family)